MTVWELILIIGLPTAITSGIVGLLFWKIERSLEKKDKAAEKEAERWRLKQETMDKARRRNEYLVIKSVSAALALGEATARAVERIPDAHCNGDMHAALDYATKIKHEQKEFLEQQGIDAIY